MRASQRRLSLSGNRRENNNDDDEVPRDFRCAYAEEANQLTAVFVKLRITAQRNKEESKGLNVRRGSDGAADQGS